MKTLLISALVLLLSACAGEYQFNSNLNGEAIDDYFRASDVTLYDNVKAPKLPYEIIGLVEGGTCQEQANDAPASISEARTLARRAAADKGANGLIIKKCLVLKEQDQGCFSHAICVGQAIKTPEANKQ
ncbi:Rcs stress response system protein RcsF [Shewanella violacea]|uniref:Lipoprotein, putative n=1 Tax=Shewanella violacea (strain JCM 10179 / CIP 106290 / LMG 19151 / DSS12) TaxID=637905 RepID=D4ZHT4_SHEVD|nr:Rcs stress response system protein RcsF [Shewanella violacea]BAJ01233.1 lipoprotein, putative [Shewanella violacea DSS12]